MAIPSTIVAWKNPMDGGAWRTTVCGVTKNWTRLSNFHIHSTLNGLARLDFNLDCSSYNWDPRLKNSALESSLYHL